MDESGALAAVRDRAECEAPAPTAYEAVPVDPATDESSAAASSSAPAEQAVEPTVSAIIVTYNHEHYIRQALDGVLSQQTTFPFEIIVSEDRSTDDTAEIVESYVAQFPNRIRLIRSEVNLRSLEVVLRAMRTARGRYITFLDGDDYWVSPNKLQSQVDFMEAHPDSAITYHDVERVTDEGDVVRVVKGLGHRGTIEDLIKGNFIATCSVMLRRAALPDLPDWITTMPAGDWPLYLLAARSGFIDHIEGIVSRYRIHGNSFWASRPLAEQQLLGLCIQVELETHLGPEYSTLFAEDRRRTARHILHSALNRPQQALASPPGDSSATLSRNDAQIRATHMRIVEMETRIREAENETQEATQRTNAATELARGVEAQLQNVVVQLQEAGAQRDELRRLTDNLIIRLTASEVATAVAHDRLRVSEVATAAAHDRLRVSEASAAETRDQYNSAEEQLSALHGRASDLETALTATQRRLRKIRRREKQIGIGLGIIIALLAGVAIYLQSL